MDALLPPLDAFAVVELAAPPELNENYGSPANTSDETESSNAADTSFQSATSHGATVDDVVAEVEGPKSAGAESVVDMNIDECVNDDSTVKGDLQLEQSHDDDLFEHQKDDEATEKLVGLDELVGSLASPGPQDDTENEVRESLNGLLDAVVLQIDNCQDGHGNYYTESEEDEEQVYPVAFYLY